MLRILGTVALLIGSNTFMTYAWYYHLKQKAWPLLVAVLASWLIALPEYCLQVPANRLGLASFGGPLSAPQLKVIQEAVTLTVFGVFSVVVLKERLRAADVAAFALVLLAVAVSMWGRAPAQP